MKTHFAFGRTARAACGKNGQSGVYRDLNKGDFERWLALPEEHKCSHCLKSYSVQKLIHEQDKAEGAAR